MIKDLEKIAELLRSEELRFLRQAELLIEHMPIFDNGQPVEDAKRVFKQYELDWLYVSWLAENDPEACLKVVEIEQEGISILPSNLDAYANLKSLYAYSGLDFEGQEEQEYYDKYEYRVVEGRPSLKVDMNPSSVILDKVDCVFALNPEDRTLLDDEHERILEHVRTEWEWVVCTEVANGQSTTREIIYRSTPRDYWHYSLRALSESGSYEDHISFSFKKHLSSRAEYEEYLYQLLQTIDIDEHRRKTFPHKIQECQGYLGTPDQLNDDLRQLLAASLQRKNAYKDRIIQEITDLEVRLAEMKRLWSEWS